MEAIIKIYLDYYNNFLSIRRFAEHYDIEPEEAKIIISLGKKYHERKCEINNLNKYMEEKKSRFNLSKS